VFVVLQLSLTAALGFARSIAAQAGERVVAANAAPI